MSDKITPVTIAQQWIDDLLPPGQHKLGEFVLLSCTPDSLHQGNNTHLWAIKNRSVNAIIVPDRRTVSPPAAMSELMEELNRADRQRQTLQKNGYHDEWDWVDVPCKIWKVAPVD